jgi:glutathione S-transferase
MIRLHDSLISGNGYKVWLLLAQLGIPFERVEYDLAKVPRPTAGGSLRGTARRWRRRMFGG